METNLEIDATDMKILALLMDDATLPYTEIAKKVNVSGGTVHVRMKKLQELGIVKGAQLNINYSKLGYDITAFLGIYLEKSSFYDQAAKDLQNIPEVVNVHYTTGNYSMFIKIICRDTRHQRTETIISLEESLNRNIDITSLESPL